MATISRTTVVLGIFKRPLFKLKTLRGLGVQGLPLQRPEKIVADLLNGRQINVHHADFPHDFRTLHNLAARIDMGLAGQGI